MSHARSRMLRSTVLAASVAVLASFVVAPAASAETPAAVTSGDTVVGELVQAWPDPTAAEQGQADPGHAGAEPLSWIEPAEGDAVRVPTDSLPDAAVGSILSVTVGDEVVDEASAGQGLEPAVEVQAATVVAAAALVPHHRMAGTVRRTWSRPSSLSPGGATSDGMTRSARS